MTGLSPTLLVSLKLLPSLIFGACCNSTLLLKGETKGGVTLPLPILSSTLNMLLLVISANTGTRPRAPLLEIPLTELMEAVAGA